MLLLPILMTIMTTVVNVINRFVLAILDNGYNNISITLDQFESSPLFYISPIVELFLVESDAVAYAVLLIYLNQKLQSAFTEGFKAVWFWCKNQTVTLWFLTTSTYSRIK